MMIKGADYDLDHNYKCRMNNIINHSSFYCYFVVLNVTGEQCLLLLIGVHTVNVVVFLRTHNIANAQPFLLYQYNYNRHHTCSSCCFPRFVELDGYYYPASFFAHTAARWFLEFECIMLSYSSQVPSQPGSVISELTQAPQEQTRMPSIRKTSGEKSSIRGISSRMTYYVSLCGKCGLNDNPISVK